MNTLLRLSFVLLLGVAAVGLFGSQVLAQVGPDKPVVNPDSPDVITLPDAGTTSTGGTAWSITNNGTGRVGYFNLNNTNTNNPALEARSASGSASATGITGLAAATAGGSFSAGVRGVNASTTANGYGVVGTQNGTGAGIYGYVTKTTGRGVFGLNTAPFGAGIGVYGESRSEGGFGVDGKAPYVGVRGNGNNTGVWGIAIAYGVYGESSQVGIAGFSNPSNGAGRGVYGHSAASAGTGVDGKSPYVGVRGNGNNTGVWGIGGTYGLYGEGVNGIYSKGSTWAAFLDGDVNVTGQVSGSTRMTVRAEHPLDSTKYVDQASILSGEQLGVYSGNAKSDAKGEAVVTLPAWFQSMYGDYRYNLTPVGGYAPLYVAAKLQDGKFRIAGGKPGLEVSWQVSGVRQDRYAKENPMQIEVSKASVAERAAGPVRSNEALPAPPK